MIKTLVTLSEYQIRKIKNAYENKASVRIFCPMKGSSSQVSTPYFWVSKNRIDKNRELKKGVILELKHDQLKTYHSGGFLPVLFAALGAIGALAGGSAAIANAIKTSQPQSAEEEEMKRHNIEMEKIAEAGSGLKKKKTKSCH